MKKITIHPVSRIEGHAKITIRLDDEGQVAGTQFHVTQIRGFEKFTEGRPYYEMPSITARICGICPVSHLLASVKACDAIMAVRIPATAAKLRELVHCAQFVQSHALSFFHLSAPDLLLGMDYDPAKRNVAGLLEEHPDALRDGIALRKFGQQVIERLAKERIHPSWTVPGGVNAPFDPHAHEKTLAELPAAQAIVPDDQALEEDPRPLPTGSPRSATSPPCTPASSAPTGRSASTTATSASWAPRAGWWPTRCSPRTTRPTSARRRWPTRT
jgi:NAD-reducing hydrogenase large subunit